MATIAPSELLTHSLSPNLRRNKKENKIIQWDEEKRNWLQGSIILKSKIQGISFLFYIFHRISSINLFNHLHCTQYTHTLFEQIYVQNDNGGAHNTHRCKKKIREKEWKEAKQRKKNNQPTTPKKKNEDMNNRSFSHYKRLIARIYFHHDFYIRFSKKELCVWVFVCFWVCDCALSFWIIRRHVQYD